ncbi:cobyrinate a,c-diamide synthase [Caldiplasma sukawensis]
MKAIGVTAMKTGSGKTTVTGALLHRLKNSVQIKIGPDFLDPIVHSKVSGNRGYNMDEWLQGRRFSQVLTKAAAKYDYAVVEGVMGMYDSGSSEIYNTFDYFRMLKIPYILVVDAFSSAESLYYMAKGFLRNLCAGVIINRYTGEKHLSMVKAPFEKNGVPIIAEIPYMEETKVSSRHLGLDIYSDEVSKIWEKISSFINTEAIGKWANFDSEVENENNYSEKKGHIDIALDDAFTFYYTDALEVLERKYNVHYFSPLNGDIPDDPDLIYFGGGYPELFPDKLGKLYRLADYLKEFRGHIYGECGGTMYLLEKLVNNDGDFYMSGVLKGKSYMDKRPVIGYTEMVSEKNNPIFRENSKLRGHEFHYSRIESDEIMSFHMMRGKGINGGDGLTKRNVLGTYSHINMGRYVNAMKKGVFSKPQ